MNASNGRPPGRRMNEVATTPSPAPGITSAPAARWKVGREFLPFHPDASHVPPDYRDGWNACYQAALRRAGVPFVQQELAAGDYQIGDVLLERKSANDLAASILDGRLFPQAEALSNAAARRCF